MLVLVLLCFAISSAEGAVLDPALYLSPSPPLRPLKGGPPDVWSRRERGADLALAVIPIEQIRTPPEIFKNKSPTKRFESTTPTAQLNCLHATAALATTTTTQETTTTTKATTTRTPSTSSKEFTSTTEPQEVMEKAETLWPLRAPIFGSIHVPLTFSLTGTYGRYGAGSGLIGSSYASLTDTDSGSGLFKMYGKSGLAGSSYGSYSGYGGGTRIYSSGGGPSWTGWGNGKWGHYGKG